MNPSEITCEYLPGPVYVPEPACSTFTEHLLYPTPVLGVEHSSDHTYSPRVHLPLQLTPGAPPGHPCPTHHMPAAPAFSYNDPASPDVAKVLRVTLGSRQGAGLPLITH